MCHSGETHIDTECCRIRPTSHVRCMLSCLSNCVVCDRQAVVFLFRFGQDGGSMVVTMADAERVLDTASKTRLCRREPEYILEVFMANCGARED